MFKVGDTVRCILPDTGGILIRDKTYIVESVSDGGQFLRVQGVPREFGSVRFAFAPPAPPIDRALILQCLRILEEETNSQSVLDKTREAIRQLENEKPTK